MYDVHCTLYTVRRTFYDNKRDISSYLVPSEPLSWNEHPLNKRTDCWLLRYDRINFLDVRVCICVYMCVCVCLRIRVCEMYIVLVFLCLHF